MTKIFGVGLAKTGTTSLCAALSELGYKTCHFPFTDSDYLQNDALADIPVADSFEKLDRRFPNSKFILTTRPMDSWLSSSEKHWHEKVENGRQNNVNTLRTIERLYGQVNFDEARFRDSYQRHLKRVYRHFEGREDDLLLFSLFEDPAPWQTLCAFLETDIPEVAFPHKNKAGEFSDTAGFGAKKYIKNVWRQAIYLASPYSRK